MSPKTGSAGTEKAFASGRVLALDVSAGAGVWTYAVVPQPDVLGRLRAVLAERRVWWCAALEAATASITAAGCWIGGLSQRPSTAEHSSGSPSPK